MPMKEVGRVCAALITVLAFGAQTATAGEHPKLDAVASYVAGHSVTVHCAEWGDREMGSALGYVWSHDLSNVYLSAYACTALADPSMPMFGSGLHILAHEAAHTRGIRDEGLAECWALVWTMDLARIFYGVQFHTWQSREIDLASQRIHNLTPPEYRAKC